MWINKESKQVYNSHSEIRAAFPAVSFPASLTEDDILFVGLAPVVKTELSYNKLTHKAVETTPVLVNKVWKQKFNLVELTPEEKQKAESEFLTFVIKQTQARLDAFAAQKGYDGILSLCTYATSTVTKFKAEGQLGVDSRDLTWSALYKLLEDVKAGLVAAPVSYADVEQVLPVLTWPV